VSVPVLAALVDWSTLLKVVAFSLAGSVGVTAAFALGIAGVSGFVESRKSGSSGTAVGFALLAVLALGACIAAVVLGIVAMTSKD
jgi:hypothetical protein